LDKENKGTSKTNEVELVIDAVEVPITVMLYRPGFMFEEVVRVRVLAKDGVPDIGVNMHELDPGSPLQARLTD